jgi:hypothetical protein
MNPKTTKRRPSNDEGTYAKNNPASTHGGDDNGDGWDLSEGQRPDEWVLDPKADEAKLPKPGEYQGFINARINEGPDVLWLIVEHGLDDHPAVSVDDTVRPLITREGSRYAKGVPEGRRLFNRLGNALGVDTSAIRDPEMISSLFSGKGATLTIVHKHKDGVTTLAVHGYAPAKGHF